MVNTFILLNDIRAIAKLLDYKRLGKQRVEAQQMLESILSTSSSKKGFANHPVVKMWNDHPMALAHYLNYMIDEWIFRGYNNTMEKHKIDLEVKPHATDSSKDTICIQIVFSWFDKIQDMQSDQKKLIHSEIYHVPKDSVKTIQDAERYFFPKWFYYKALQVSHKCSLLRKDPKYYSDLKEFKLDEIEEKFMFRGYIWPAALSVSQLETVAAFNDSKKQLELLTDVLAICSPFGSSVPAHFRLTKKQIEAWLLDKAVNPLTGRTISDRGSIYKDFISAAKHFELL